MASTFEDILKREGRLVYKTTGSSMLPMLHQNRDLVIIENISGSLKRLDVALYRRGSDYVLHRIVAVRKDVYLIRGDNTYVLEQVPAKNVLGVLTSFVRKGKQYSVTDPSYRFYVRLWNTLYPFRFLCVFLFHTARKAARMLGLTSLIRKVIRRE